jgi:hypothetical protein
MISTYFEISLPNQNWKTLYGKSGKTPFPHKFCELNVYRNNVILGYRFHFSTQTDHAGLSLSISLFSFGVEFEFYDDRHWDNKNNCYEEQND